MKHITQFTTLLLALSCTKKMPTKDFDFAHISSKAVKEAVAEPPKATAKKNVEPPQLIRVDEDTLLVRGEEVGVLDGTEVTLSSIIDIDATKIISKNDSLFEVKVTPLPEMPVLEVKSAALALETETELEKETDKDKEKEKVEESLVLEIKAEPQTEIMIIAGASENSSENLCLAQSGPDAGKFVAADSAECWIKQEDVTALPAAIENQSESSTVTIALNSKDALASLGDLPFLTVQVKPSVPEVIPASNSETSLKQSDSETIKAPTIAVVVPEVSAEIKDVIESLPIVLSEIIEKEANLVTTDPNLAGEDVEKIQQLTNRMARATVRYQEKKLRHHEKTQERKRLRQERRLNREKIAKVKNAENRICRRKKQEKCDDLTGIVQELAEKENKKTKEIAVLKEEIEVAKTEALEEIKEIHANQSEIKALAKKSKN